MIVNEKEKQLIINELTARLKDLIYMHGRAKMAEVVEKMLPDIREEFTDDWVHVKYQLDFISGDIIQIVGRERRKKMNDNICSECKIETLFNFIQPLFHGEWGGYALVCPECALKITNEIHGMNRTEFNGEMAQQLLEDFREWKNANTQA